MKTVHYFAYGSNLCLRRIRDRTPSASVVARAKLSVHALRFHKVGFRDGSGKCDAYHTGMAADHIWGVVYALDADEKRALDRVEGLGCGYVEKIVDVEAAVGRISATTYVASPHATKPDLAPYAWYKEFVVAGAVEHGFSQEYVEAIRAVVAVDDPDEARATEHRRILSSRAGS